jgi:hypothetical protein
MVRGGARLWPARLAWLQRAGLGQSSGDDEAASASARAMAMGAARTPLAE